ncbi:hypothetical protein BKA70DRAFT_1438522 [Coprinopsis sp. MPI-PUGE-AT-0042]|nr:hypothetical protein BKA70DRAFT_1438522 [Coprinopsis sp. MPI-PUGE-AT-0042]
MMQPSITLDLTQYLSPPNKRNTDLQVPIRERMVTGNSAFQLFTNPFTPFLCGAPDEGHYTAGRTGPNVTVTNQAIPSTNMSPTKPTALVETWTIDYELRPNTILRIGQKVRLWCRFAHATPREGTLAAITGYTNMEVYFRLREDDPEDRDLIVYLSVPIHSTSLAEGSGFTHWALSKLLLRKKILKDQVTKWADDTDRMNDIESNIQDLGITNTLPTRTGTSGPQRLTTPQDHGQPVASSGASATAAIIALGQTAWVRPGTSEVPPKRGQKIALRMASASTLRGVSIPLGRLHHSQEGGDTGEANDERPARRLHETTPRASNATNVELSCIQTLAPHAPPDAFSPGLSRPAMTPATPRTAILGREATNGRSTQREWHELESDLAQWRMPLNVTYGRLRGCGFGIKRAHSSPSLLHPPSLKPPPNQSYSSHPTSSTAATMPHAKRNANPFEHLDNDPGHSSPEPTPSPNPKTSTPLYPRPKGKESTLIPPPEGIAPNSIKLYLRSSSGKTTKDKQAFSLPGSYAAITAGTSVTPLHGDPSYTR